MDTFPSWKVMEKSWNFVFEFVWEPWWHICTKYEFDIFQIIFGSYGGHRRHMTDDRRQTTPGVCMA